MRTSVLLDTLQNLIGRKPKAEDFVKILELNSKKTFYARVQRDSEFSDEEIKRLERFYTIKIPREEPSDCIELDYFPEVFGSCGSGAFVLSEQKEKICVPKDAFVNFSSVKTYSVINAIGDSMQPTISDKDKLIVEHWEGEQIKDNRVYVFCYNNEVFVKRLVKNVDEIIIKSDNADPMYRPRYIEKEDINSVIIIGQIVGLMRNME